MKNHHCRKFWIAIGVIQIATVFYLCLKKPGIIESTFPINDKVSHCFAYTLLSWWFFQLYRKPKTISISFFLMGILIESLQRQLYYHFFEIADIAANLIGIVLGLTVLTLVFKNSLLLVDNKIFTCLNGKRTCR